MEINIENINEGDVIQERVIQEHINERFKQQPVKKILLVNPPDVDSSVFDFTVAKRGRSNNYPAYGLGVIAKHLQLNNFDVEICNLNHDLLKIVTNCENGEKFNYDETWQRILDDYINSFKPDMIGVTCIFSVTHSSFVKVCQYTKTSKKPWHSNGDIPLVIGGVHVTHDLDSMLKDIPEADYIFLNEAELALTQFLKFVNGETDSTALGQIVFPFKSRALKFLKNVTPQSDDLNIIPAFELMDINSHSKVGTLGSWYGFLPEGTPVATVQSNRGCRAACTFCNVRTFHGVGVRQRSVESVLDELTLLKEKHGIKHIIWLDDDLLKNEKRAVELFNGMVQRNLDITWDATNGVIAYSLLKKDVINAAAESGCIGLNIGIESGNPDILFQIKKPGKVETFLKAAEMLYKFPQINSRALFIIGFPNETLRMMFDTIHLAEQMNLDWHNLAILQPWKDTPIYDAMVEEGLLGDEEGSLIKEEEKGVAPYQLGTYSRQRAIEKGLIQQSHFGEKEGINQGFLERIKISNLDEVPDAKYLDDIWFYMNVRLNFARLLREKREIKLAQQHKFLAYISNKTAPDNALIMYFYAFIQKKVEGMIDPGLKNRLHQRLNSSEYWNDRFRYFGLSFNQVKDEFFPDNISDGGIPNNFKESSSIFHFPTEKIT